MESKSQSEKRFIGLSTVIVVLGMVSLMTDLSSQMIVPILPLYLTSVLHVQVGTVGFIEGKLGKHFKVFLRMDFGPI